MKKKKSTRKSEPTAKDSYGKPQHLLDLIDRYLRHHEDSEELKRRITGAGNLTKEQADEYEVARENLKNEKENIDAARGRILNKYVFPAMAILTVLLEQMKVQPYIREVFEDDIQELFLQVSNQKPGQSIFHRFVEACLCKWERGKQPKHSAAPPPDFRAILGEYMQRAVFEMMKEMMSLKFEDAYFREQIIVDDMTRPVIWSKYFAAEAFRSLDPNLKPDKNGMPQGEHSRPASF